MHGLPSTGMYVEYNPIQHNASLTPYTIPNILAYPSLDLSYMHAIGTLGFQYSG